MEEPGESRRLSHSRSERGLLSFFFLLHFGAALVYLAPAARATLEVLPPWLEPVLVPVPPVVRAVSPVTEPYLRLTAARQNWAMFAPEPVSWSNSVRVVAFYPLHGTGGEPPAATDDPGGAETGGKGDEGAGGGAGGAGGAGEADRTDRWRADTLVLTGPRETPFPHWSGHRPYRLWHNIGLVAWERGYRPLLADYLCRTLTDERGLPPDGLTLHAVWEPTRLPWGVVEGKELYDQELGGYDCEGGA